jgi:hypothetical protein
MSIWPTNRVNPIAPCREANLSTASSTDPPTSEPRERPSVRFGVRAWDRGTRVHYTHSSTGESHGGFARRLTDVDRKDDIPHAEWFTHSVGLCAVPSANWLSSGDWRLRRRAITASPA